MQGLWNTIETWILTSTPDVGGIRLGYLLLLVAIVLITFLARWILVNVIIKAVELLTRKTKN